MFLFIPIQTEVVFLRWPWMNFILMGLCVFTFFFLNLFGVGGELLEWTVLDGWSPTGMVGHAFLHAGFWHLFGNMVFLWVFGNAVNERMGQLRYLLFYLGAAVFSATIHLLFDGAPAIGASGAINGVVGAYLILYPTNRVSCFWIFLFKGGVFHLTGYILIVFWFIRDIVGASTGAGNIAYWAHLGGFMFGVIAGGYLLRQGHIQLSGFDNPDLLTILKWNKPSAAPDRVPNLMPDEIGFNCPACGKPQRVREAEFGTSVRCWSCRVPIFLEEDVSA